MTSEEFREFGWRNGQDVHAFRGGVDYVFALAGVDFLTVRVWRGDMVEFTADEITQVINPDGDIAYREES